MATTTVSGSTVTFSNSGAAAISVANRDRGWNSRVSLRCSGGRAVAGTKTTIYSVDDGVQTTMCAAIVITNKASRLMTLIF